MQLNGAIQGAISAYINHSNSVLGGDLAINHEALNLLNNDFTTVKQEDDAAAANGAKGKRKRNAKPKDPNAPKRPITAYLLFLETERANIQQSLGPEQKRGDISVEGTRRWHALDPAEQQVMRLT